MNDSARDNVDMTFGLPIREGRTFPCRRKRRKILNTVLCVTPINLAVSSVVFRIPKTSQTIRQRRSSLQGAGIFCEEGQITDKMMLAA